MTYRFTSVALTELRESSLQYEAKEKGLGFRFFQEVEQTIERILTTPEAWRRLSLRTRRCLVHNFPFGVLYQFKRTEILIVSIMDLRRDPATWRKYL
jgi:hypothetical protein